MKGTLIGQIGWIGRISRIGWSVLLAALAGVFAAAASELVTATVDSGGGRSSSANYTLDASIGGIGGISLGGDATARLGYCGQLTEVATLSVTGTPAQVPETSTTQLSGTATLDDDTHTALAGSEIAWAIPTWPIAQISASGVASAAVVYANLPATVNGSYGGVPGSASLLVLDMFPDNYGSYAGDGLPDNWQYQYFGLDNPNAAPAADVTGTGQNNQFKYVAGLDPTNAASVFRLRIEPVAGQANQKRLVFAPRWNDRTYTPQFRTNLVSGTAWTNLTTFTITDNGTERTVVDTNATGTARFYRVQITYP